MNTISLKSGRQSQKRKTRQNILASAQKLLSMGQPFTLEDVAKHSKTSRATVYRYFSNIDILCSEAGIDFHTKTPEELIEDSKHLSLLEQILYVQNYFNELSFNNEAAFRKYLSVYLKEDFTNKIGTVRGARRTATLELVLESYKKKLGESTYKKLIANATVLMGIEPVIITKDVVGLDNSSAKKSLAWGFEMLLKGIDTEIFQVN